MIWQKKTIFFWLQAPLVSPVFPSSLLLVTALYTYSSPWVVLLVPSNHRAKDEDAYKEQEREYTLHLPLSGLLLPALIAAYWTKTSSRDYDVNWSSTVACAGLTTRSSARKPWVACSANKNKTPAHTKNEVSSLKSIHPFTQYPDQMWSP